MSFGCPLKNQLEEKKTRAIHLHNNLSLKINHENTELSIGNKQKNPKKRFMLYDENFKICTKCKMYKRNLFSSSRYFESDMLELIFKTKYSLPVRVHHTPTFA